jgi:hypothetical protein
MTLFQDTKLSGAFEQFRMEFETERSRSRDSLKRAEDSLDRLQGRFMEFLQVVQSLEHRILELETQAKAQQALPPVHELAKTHVDDFKALLEKANLEKLDLLNRLLARHNVSAVGVPAVASADPAPPIQILSPFGSVPAEMHDPLKDSWIAEETEYIIQTRGLPPDIARAEAERAFVSTHQVIT